MQHWLTEEHRQAILADSGCTTGLPNHAYTSEAFFQWERDNLFAATWACVGNASDVPDPGCLKPVSLLGIPLLMVRNHANEIRVFHNVCSHRGNELVWQPCKVNKLISCPYHAWTYDLDGSLRATPHVGGTGKNQVEGLDHAQHGLRAVRSETWMGLVFVNVSGDAPNFREYIAPLQQRVDDLGRAEQFAALKPSSSHGQLTLEFQGNWKLCVENNLESYHLPWVHPGLNAVSKLEDHYHFYGDDFYAGQGSREYDHTKVHERYLPQFDGWPEKVAEYPTLYPNVFLGLHCDHYWTRVIEPVSPTVTRDHLQIYYLGDASEDPAYEAERKKRMDTWAEVFYEDIGVVEGMQRGRYSPAFEGGVFTPLMDEPSHHFAKWVANRL